MIAHWLLPVALSLLSGDDGAPGPRLRPGEKQASWPAQGQTGLVLTILLVIIFAGLAIGGLLWALQYMVTHCCPTCYEDERGTEEVLIPIIPFFRSFCPACSTVCRTQDAVYKPLRAGAAPAAPGAEDDEDDAPTLL